MRKALSDHWINILVFFFLDKFIIEDTFHLKKNVLNHLKLTIRMFWKISLTCNYILKPGKLREFHFCK